MILRQDQLFKVMKPLLQSQAQQGNRVPSRLPNIELSDIDPDPERAKQTLGNFEKNLSGYLEKNQDPLFPKEDEWEVPPISTELRIFGSKKDNNTPQVIDAIKRIAGDDLGNRTARREGIVAELERAEAPYATKGFPFIQDTKEKDVYSIYEQGKHFEQGQEYPSGYKVDELTGKKEYQWAGGEDMESQKMEEIEPPELYQPKEGYILSRGGGKDWKSSFFKKDEKTGKLIQYEPKSWEEYYIIRDNKGNSTLFSEAEFQKVKEYIEKMFDVDKDTGVMTKKKR